jgi:signal transduction histidine kinase
MVYPLLRAVSPMVVSTPSRARAKPSRGSLLLVAAMLAAIGAVTWLAWWDSHKESEAILDDVGKGQSVVAAVVARDLLTQLETAGLRGDRASEVTAHAGDLIGDAIPAGEREEMELLIAPPAERAFHSSDGRVLSFAPLRDALDRNQSTMRLGRPEAMALGLTPRTAVAGLAHVDAGTFGRWGVVAVATAAPHRDRETRAFWRLVLGVALAAGLVLAFGGVALRNQRKELEAKQALVLAQVERQRDEQLARAERVATTGTFALGIVHEVSTPLAVIMGRAEQLRGRVESDERGGHAVRAIIEQVDRIQRIIRRFLDMARGGPPSLTRTHARDVIRSAVSSIEHRFAKANVALSTDVPTEDAQILCDRALLEQALVNLLLNACDACSAGGHVEISTRSDAQHVVFVVTDDGVGIAPQVAAHATDPFFTTKPAGAGTGLGLAIASEIAKSHRGTLRIAPSGGHGSRASIAIPLAPTDAFRGT